MIALNSSRSSVAVGMLWMFGSMMSGYVSISDLTSKSPVAREFEGINHNTVAAAASRQYQQERRIQFPKLVRGNPDSKLIALTFDDGPHPGKTERLLEILKQEGVKATFFVVGKMVDRNPDLVQREAADGHEIANHTYDHIRLPSLDARQIEYQILEGSKAVNRAIGKPARLFRPPGGEYTDQVVSITKRIGHVMVLWTDDPADYANPGAKKIEERTLAHASNGGIILLHDGIEQTVEVLPDIIRQLKSRGYRFVTCSELALEHGAVIMGGPKIAARPLPAGLR